MHSRSRQPTSWECKIRTYGIYVQPSVYLRTRISSVCFGQTLFVVAQCLILLFALVVNAAVIVWCPPRPTKCSRCVSYQSLCVLFFSFFFRCNNSWFACVLARESSFEFVINTTILKFNDRFCVGVRVCVCAEKQSHRIAKIEEGKETARENSNHIGIK